MKKIYVLAGAVTLCLVGCGINSTANDPAPTFVSPDPVIATSPIVAPSTYVSPIKPKVAPTTVKPVVTIDGDDLVLVGTDVPPGTYRTNDKVDGMCYWAKTKDAEGSDIIDNGIPSGGHPQVTLKKGQWFTSQGCPFWKKQ